MSHQTGWNIGNLKFVRGVYTDRQIDRLVHLGRFKVPIRFFLAVPALLVGIGLCSSAFTQDLRRHVRAGSKITPERAESLEAELVENAEDLIARAQLLGYYFLRQFRDDEAHDKHREHVLWLIKNAPEANALAGPEARLSRGLFGDGYVAGKNAWSWHLENDPNNLAVLHHAAVFFTQSDRKLAIQLLERAQSIDAGDPEWARQLGHLHRLDSRLRDGKRDPKASMRALAQFERAYESSDELRRSYLLTDLGVTAFNAGAIEKAKDYAEAMLRGNGEGRNHGDRVHYGNLTLGRVALLDGDVEEAKVRLIAAGRTPGSPTLNSFGPDMTLASELLELGESEVVLAYFSLCSEFWRMDRGDLETWTGLVKGGDTPDFGRSLRF